MAHEATGGEDHRHVRIVKPGVTRRRRGHRRDVVMGHRVRDHPHPGGDAGRVALKVLRNARGDGDDPLGRGQQQPDCPQDRPVLAPCMRDLDRIDVVLTYPNPDAGAAEPLRGERHEHRVPGCGDDQAGARALQVGHQFRQRDGQLAGVQVDQPDIAGNAPVELAASIEHHQIDRMAPVGQAPRDDEDHARDAAAGEPRDDQRNAGGGVGLRHGGRAAHGVEPRPAPGTTIGGHAAAVLQAPGYRHALMR